MELRRVERIYPVEYMTEVDGVLRSQIAFVTPSGVKSLSTARYGVDDEVRLVLLPVERALSDLISASLVAGVAKKADHSEQ